nr:calcium/sodium antiporter [Spirochaeta sp.]
MLFILVLLVSLGVLIKGADVFITGAVATARHFRVSPLLVGMVIVGFGTSAPEMLVSTMSAVEGASGIALGNAWGSNIANIALILGVTALIRPVTVQSRVLRTELPILLGVTVLAGVQVIDGSLGRWDAVLLLVLFAGFLFWSIRFQRAEPTDPLADQVVREVMSDGGEDGGEDPGGRVLGGPRVQPVGRSVVILVIGLVLLIGGSRGVVWGAVGLARAAGISDLIIGLTIVAIGTSLPELASSIAAIRKGEDEIAFGNVVGSNMFNTLIVVGLAGVIRPFPVERMSLVRDVPVMVGLTVLMLLFGIGRRGRAGRINRVEAAVLCLVYAGYLAWLQKHTAAAAGAD